MKTGKTINLAKPDKDNICDARTCCIVTTSKDINLIVAHFPWIKEEIHIKAITEIINAHISSNGPIIILTDANDGETLISKEKPLVIRGKKLSHGLSQVEAKETLKTCCWHEKDNKKQWKHMEDTGDYILSENVTYIGIPKEIEKPSNDISESDLYSDHMPVMATISLKPQYTQQQTQKKHPWNSSTRIA
jgi:endonuclease/exonuclease/phosphatase family metal-dependent hydrolase